MFIYIVWDIVSVKTKDTNGFSNPNASDLLKPLVSSENRSFC